MKPNNIPLYVHNQSNHPPTIIKNIPKSINNRLTSISSDENAFKQSSATYQEALTKSGYRYKLSYPTQTTDPINNTQRNRRKRKITWFNPPFSANVSTNVGKKFLKLIDKCFPIDHQLHRLINRNTIKVSYKCMPNINQIISKHNKSILGKNEINTSDNTCNCRNRQMCPLDGNCLANGVIYQAIVDRQDNNKTENYVGLTENSFKTRYNNHTSSFRNQSKRHNTTLSQYIWSLKDQNIPYTLKWKILAKGRPYTTSTKSCNLCLMEKYLIICKPHLATLNIRNELSSECRHKKKHLLCNFQPTHS